MSGETGSRFARLRICTSLAIHANVGNASGKYLNAGIVPVLPYPRMNVTLFTKDQNDVNAVMALFIPFLAPSHCDMQKPNGSHDFFHDETYAS